MLVLQGSLLYTTQLIKHKTWFRKPVSKYLQAENHLQTHISFSNFLWQSYLIIWKRISDKCCFLDHQKATQVLQNPVAFLLSFRDSPNFTTSKLVMICLWVVIALNAASVLQLNSELSGYDSVCSDTKKPKSTKPVALISSEINLQLPPASFTVGIVRV